MLWKKWYSTYYREKNVSYIWQLGPIFFHLGSLTNCHSLIASTYFCSHMTSFLSFSVFPFRDVSHLFSTFFFCYFARLLLKHFVFIIIWINNWYTVSCCMNTYHACSLINSWSWHNHNDEIFWHNLHKAIVLYLL